MAVMDVNIYSYFSHGASAHPSLEQLTEEADSSQTS